MRNGIVAHLGNAITATLAIFTLTGVLSDKLADAITLAVLAWVSLWIAFVNDRRSRNV